MIERRRRLQNRILRTLPSAEYRRLTASARIVQLRVDRVLHDFDRQSPYVYFPMSGVCGVTLLSHAGERFHVASIGCEGVTSIYRSYRGSSDAQLGVDLQPAIALQIPADDFEREMDQHLTLRALVREFYTAFNFELMLSVACNRLHSLRQRYCRHLLALADRLACDEVRLTHTAMASILGTTRPSVTLLSVELKRKRAIAYGRNALTILDRPQVEAMACECYQTMRGRFGRLLPPRD